VTENRWVLPCPAALGATAPTPARGSTIAHSERAAAISGPPIRRARLTSRFKASDWVAQASCAPGLLVDGETRPRLFRDMAIYIISEAKPKLGALVKQASAGETVQLLNGKNMVALVPAHPTIDVTSSLDVPGINERLAASEQTPSAPWSHGDARRLAKRVLRRKPVR
jgi:hypothetical protein